jgi:beta-lactamase regulating signal transducer with metallopeptidase domain
MQSPVFEHAFLLQSLGWAIANSFWQAGILWLLYRFIVTTDKKLPASIKYNLGTALLFTTLAWFLISFFQNYQSLLIGSSTDEAIYYIPKGELTLKLVKNICTYLSLIYLLLLGFYSVVFYKNLLSNRFLQKKGLNKAPIDYRIFVEKTASQLGINKKIKLWISDKVDVPAVTGFIKPVILLPAAMINQLTIAQVEAVLLHELAHIRRNDYLYNILQSVVELILFFNPFVHLLSKSVRKEREYCCDDWVMNFQFDRLAYAKALLLLEEQRYLLQSRFILAATNGEKKLLNRVKRLFNQQPETDFTLLLKIKLGVVCLFLLFVIFSALPTISNNTTKTSATTERKNEPLLPGTLKKPTIENSTFNIINSISLKSDRKNYPLPTKKKVKGTSKTAPEGDYVNAYINEDLLNTAIRDEVIPSQVVEKELPKLTSLVKIEYQQSGKKQVSTYYFELKNNNGNAALKPLIMLNKYHAKAKKDITKSPLNSIDSIAKPAKKKGITT